MFWGREILNMFESRRQDPSGSEGAIMRVQIYKAWLGWDDEHCLRSEMGSLERREGRGIWGEERMS